MSGPYRSPSPPGADESEGEDSPAKPIDLGALRSTHEWPAGQLLDGHSLSWRGLSHVVAERDSIVFYASGPIDGRFDWVKLVHVPHPTVLLDVLRLRTRVVIDGLRLRAAE